MENFSKIIILFAASIFLLSCNDSTTEVAVTPYNISGNVTDLNGNPLDDVDVYFVYHFNELPANELPETINADTLYQNYPNPFSDFTNIRFETYRSIRYEVKFINYFNPSSSIVLQGTSAPGVVETPLGNFNDHPNGIYRLAIRYIVDLTTRFNSKISIFINRTQPNELVNAKPNIKAVNGKFNVNLPELFLQKIINFTVDSTKVIPKQVSGLMTFVLMKDGYKTLQVDYNIDRYNQNDLTFQMKKE